MNIDIRLPFNPVHSVRCPDTDRKIAWVSEAYYEFPHERGTPALRRALTQLGREEFSKLERIALPDTIPSYFYYDRCASPNEPNGVLRIWGAARGGKLIIVGLDRFRTVVELRRELPGRGRGLQVAAA